jgi:long-chain acyl-CoA synthetase
MAHTFPEPTTSANLPRKQNKGASMRNNSANDSVYDSSPWVKQYVPGVHTQIRLPDTPNIGVFFEEACKKYSQLIAFTCCLPNGLKGQLTYQEVDALSTKFAAYLRNTLKLKKGERVAVQMPNCLSQPIVVIGVFKAGLTLVNVNPLYTPDEMSHQLLDSQSKALVIIDMFADKLPSVLPRTELRHIVTVSIADFFSFPLSAIIKLKLKLEKKVPRCNVHAERISQAISLGGATLTDSQAVWKPKECPNNETPVGLDDIACLQYTGGTTGVSKGAMLTHGNLINQMQQICDMAHVTIEPGREVILTALPLYHIFAFSVNLLVFFHKGAHNILIPSPRPIQNLQKAFKLFDITWITGVNTLFAALAAEDWFQKSPPKKLRVALAGGTALLQSTAKRFREVTGATIVEGYGLTESSPVICVNPIGGLIQLGTIGVPLPSTSVRIVDDSGITVPLGERGELIAKGPQIMSGYWRRPDESEKCLIDGWLFTGDVATMDAHGFFTIVDRKKDMIIVSGFNVYPNEVEDVLTQHPSVLEAAVIGVPDEHSGEAVRAYVVLKNDQTKVEDIKAFCREHLTGYKLPKLIEIRKELPKTPVGKILRKDLKKEYLEKNAS